MAQPDDFYPDWLWQLLDDPKEVGARQAAKREVDKKKEIYVQRLKDEYMEKQLEESKKARVVPAGVKRTEDEKLYVRREAQAEKWRINRDKEYDNVPQYEMPPERSVKFHKKINKQKIIAENYLRARGMK